MATRVAVLLERGRRRTFACALDWPGWARSATGAHADDDALEVLESYRARYAEVLASSGVDAPSGRLVVTETLAGNATTDFGAPAVQAAADVRALRRADRERLAAILDATWARFDDVCALASPLVPGPRGGGRSLEKVRRHVTDAEVAYARGLGMRVRATNGDDELVGALRARILDVVRHDAPTERVATWPVRYLVRRGAWHVVDHLFEIEDRQR